MVGKPERQVAVFGAGYIGLVTGACLAELGHRVVVRDIDPEKVALLRSGDVPIYEPGLGDMIVRNKERLTFTLDLEEALGGAEIAYVCVDTPPSASGDADLSRIWAVVRSLEGATHLKAVVVKSTVPVGTGARVRSALDAAGLAHVGYAANPEFTAEGRAVTDFMRPDRIVIGASDEATAQLIADLHDGVEGPVVVMDVRSAEMVKLASNALLATKISFINEIATLCEKTGADVEEVARAVGLDHRLGPHFLRPGIGWGGSCFPKDSEALRQLASNTGYHLQLLSAVIEVNNLQKRRAIQKLKDELGTLAGMRVALLGLTFKPGTDDMREATSTVLASRLLAEGAEVRCWDPMARPGEVEPWVSTTRHATPEEAMAGADAVILVTEWPQLKEVDWARAGAAMRRPVLFDGRNLLDPAAMRALGYTYMSVGRP
ncbi:UDP-glucose dehydrogenase [[Actinomadura] parvosata subsp. kistnae]|uniref:UDP-glucose 6-dehydrogenase n=1 Tax=[Actinomadura] parvosata subsp. kistnae TaxID=1909395 RepID=A0A1V0A240_9ACTN|nr:UDP-glucose/GDP-mannose dehydrogenase family protein [Nonomuraea sp. ATCC 55076]AQZ64239.1 nucleotide sugar dehydrogenase [Nonomuraea sp. ATCC 55076]SPM00076.1 UDP-glucose dehydrogenase [Actinomadura parvosata subsp. kistnae]